MTLDSSTGLSRLDIAGVSAERHDLAVRGLGLTLAILLAPVLFMAAVAVQPWIDPADLLRDPLAVAELKQPDCCKVYYGAVSNMGVLLWAAATAVCLFAAAVVLAEGRRMHPAVFLGAAGLLTGLLAVDDLFLVHENVLPAFGVPQPVTYGAYAALGLAYLLVSWREILRHNVVLLGAAIALLGTSALIDWFLHSDHPLRILLEDGAKLAGICAWVGFHVLAAWTILVRVVAPRRVFRYPIGG